MKKKTALLIFAKNPVIGKVKTRLAATLGNQFALSIYQELLQYTKFITKELPCEKIVFYSDHLETEDLWQELYYKKKVQMGCDLGERMYQAFAYAFTEGFLNVSIIGTDCPQLNKKIIADSFAALGEHDLAIGPATDGGYYLMAMKKPHRQLFDNITWSTNTVFEQTLTQARRLGLSVFQLPYLSDVDDEEDYQQFKSFFKTNTFFHD